MMKLRNVLWILLALGSFSVVALLVRRDHTRPGTPPNSVQGQGPLSGLKSDRLRDFRLAEEDRTRSSLRHTFTNRTAILKIETVRGIDPDAAGILLNDGIMGLEALYASALSPYPGDISHQVVVDARYRPQFFRKAVGQTPYSYYLLFANDRLGYGAATADAIKYRSLRGWFYCGESGEFYKVKLFMPPKTASAELESLFLSLTCR